jgi:hypothetical protein
MLGMHDTSLDGLDFVERRNGSAIFDWRLSDGPNAGVAIPTAVATVLDTDAMSLPPLAQTIDPEQLNTLLVEGADVRITFSYQGCEVVVDAVGRLRVVE